MASTSIGFNGVRYVACPGLDWPGTPGRFMAHYSAYPQLRNTDDCVLHNGSKYGKKDEDTDKRAGAAAKNSTMSLVRGRSKT